MKVDDPRTFAIIGAAMAVHGELGCGFLEAVYQEALAFEMTRRRIPFQKECELPIYYDGARLNTFYRVDFLCFDAVIVETKAVAQLTKAEDAQVLNYLKASHLEVGLLLNFGTPSLQHKRYISNSKWRPPSPQS